MIKYISTAIILAATATHTYAGCSNSIEGTIGTTCYDSRAGNSYNTQRYGSKTIVNGYNASTGTSWNQTTYRVPGGGPSTTSGSSSTGSMWSNSRSGNTTWDWNNRR